MAMPHVIALMGPTCTGKTDHAIRIAQRVQGEIISVDSALVYKEMNIGTAKPSPAELSQAPHHLIDILDPSESYSAAQFSEDANRLILEISQRGNVPILAGGTMLYYRALINGMASMPEADKQLRHQLQNRLEAEGAKTLHDELARVDPVSAARIHLNDPQRLLRALEVYEVSGKTLTQHHQEQTAISLPFNILKLGLIPSDRARHRKLVAERFESMLNQGFIEEVERLKKSKELHIELPSMRSVGYRQIWNYLSGECSFDEMKDKGVAATRQLAKRQMTWLRKESDLNNFDCFTVNDCELFNHIDVFLSRNC